MNFLDTLQEARSPHNQIITGLGNGWVSSQSNHLRAIESQVDQVAGRQGVDPGYLRYSLLTPDGKRVLNRLDLKDLWVMVAIWESLSSPRIGRIGNIPETEAGVEAASQDLNAWAGTTLRAEVGRSLVLAARSKVTDMDRTLTDMYGKKFDQRTLRTYILDRFLEAVEQRPQWFLDPGLVQTLRGGWSRPL